MGKARKVRKVRKVRKGTWHEASHYYSAFGGIGCDIVGSVRVVVARTRPLNHR